MAVKVCLCIVRPERERERERDKREKTGIKSVRLEDLLSTLMKPTTLHSTDHSLIPQAHATFTITALLGRVESLCRSYTGICSSLRNVDFFDIFSVVVTLTVLVEWA